MTTMQRCITCSTELPVSEFWKQPSKKSGLQGSCKHCQRARNSEWIANNRQRFREANFKATRKARLRHPLKAIVYAAKHRSAKMGIDFDLDFREMSIPDNCPVLGIPIFSSMGNGGYRDSNSAPSLDRIDPAKGYTKDNVIIVSMLANRIKTNAYPDQILKVAEFYGKLFAEKGWQTDLPAVQPHKKEKDGKMFVSIAK